MTDIFREHRGFWNRQNKKSLYLGILLLALSLVIQINAGRYSARTAASANFAGDIFLDNLPVLNLNFLIVQGGIIFWTLAFCFLIFRPRHLLFGIKAIALFIIFRAFFISLTHVGIYPRQIVFNPAAAGYGFYKYLTFQGNFFFSGHTGFPFLMALLFWHEKWWRRFFLLATAFFASTVLLAHVHYSIDVFAAPFMAYGIFKIATHLFSHDYSLSHGHGDV